MALNLPQIKKTVSSFISDEEGRIPKKSAVRIGSVIGGIATASLILSAIPCVSASSHGSHCSVYDYNQDTVTLKAGWNPNTCAVEVTHDLHSSHVNANICGGI
jgi:hypothetical protein